MRRAVWILPLVFAAAMAAFLLLARSGRRHEDPAARARPVAVNSSAHESLAAPRVASQRSEAEAAPVTPPREEPVSAAPNAGTSTPITGLLIDAHTGEALPAFRIELSTDGPFGDTQLLATDASGAFRTTGSYGPNEREVWIDFLDDRSGLSIAERMRHYRALSYDEQGEAQGYAGSSRWPEWRSRWSPGDPPLRVEREVGPTYRLRLVGAGGRAAERFLAAISGDPHPQHLTPQLPGAAFSRLRSGDPAWVRMRQRDRTLHASSEAWSLHVVSDDGLLAGVAKVKPAEKGVVSVALRPTGRALVHVTTAHELGTDAFRIVATTLGGVRLATLEHPRLMGTRTFALAHLPPGPCRVTVDAPRHRSFQVEADIAPGADTDVVATLTQADASTTISGTASSRTGTYTHRPHVVATHQVTGRVRRAPIEWTQREEDRAWTGSFCIEDLDPGPHNVVVDDWDHWRWTPLAHSVEAPATDVHFEADDRGERSVLRVEVLSPDGSELFGARVQLRLDDERSFVREDGASVTEMSAPASATLDWQVSVRGYRTRTGTGIDLEPFERGRRLRVQLEESDQRPQSVRPDTE